MKEIEFNRLLHRRLAQVSIGPSAIRNQGAAGLIKTLRDYIEKEVDLKVFAKLLQNENRYLSFLDHHTEKILKQFPKHANSWGAARKGLNLFLREVVYSNYFSHKYSIPQEFKAFNNHVKFMEVPLDKEVAQGLISDSDGQLPKWVNIKKLNQGLSRVYQEHAKAIALKEGVARVNLDLKYWRSK